MNYEMLVNDLRKQKCCNCEMIFAMPEYFYVTAFKLKDKLTFYCPAGHPQNYVSGKSYARKFLEAQEENDRLNRELISTRLESDNSIKKLERRIKNGVCPCCTRTFSNMQKHIASKHPEFKNGSVVKKIENKNVKKIR